MTSCLDGCSKCLDMKDFKSKVDDGLFPNFNVVDYDIEVGDLLYHFNLKQHGFCILKVTKTEKFDARDNYRG